MLADALLGSSTAPFAVPSQNDASRAETVALMAAVEAEASCMESVADANTDADIDEDADASLMTDRSATSADESSRSAGDEFCFAGVMFISATV